MGCANTKNPPKGAFTAQEYAEYTGIAPTTAQWRLERLVKAGKLRAGLFLVGAGRKKYYWLAGLLLVALGHAQTQIDINRQTRGTLQPSRGGTGQTAWVAGKCVQVAADGTRLESAPEACGGGGGGGGDITAVGTCTSGDCFVNVPANRVLASPSGSTGPVTDRALVVSDIPGLPASKITSGTFADARIAQSNVTQHQGALQLSASQIVSGVLPIARGGTGRSSWTANRCVQVDANGNLDVAPWPCSGLSGSGTGDRLPLWTGSTTLGNSSLAESSTEFSTSKPINAPVWDKGGAVCNVKAYGAKGDGVANDTAAIQSAVNACPASGTVYLPPGSYKITQTIIITKALNIQGSHNRYTALVPTTNNVISIESNESVRVADILIYAPVGQTSGSLITVTGEQYLGTINPVFERVRLRGGYNQINIHRAVETRIVNCVFAEWNNAAVRVQHHDHDTGHAWILNSSFAWPYNTTSAYGVYVENSVGPNVSHSFFLGVPRAFYWYRNTNVGSYLMNFSNNYVDGTKNGWIVIEGPGTGHVFSLSIVGNHFFADSSADPNVSQIRLQGAFYGATIMGNTIVCSGRENETGLLLANNWGGISVSGNWFTNCSTAVREQITGSGSTVTIEANDYQWILGPPVSSSGKAIVKDGSYLWSHLSGANGAFANGSEVYCNDCRRTEPCSGGGSGAFARRINGQWVCAEGDTLGGFDPLDENNLWIREEFLSAAATSPYIGAYGWSSSCTSGTVSHVSKTGSSPFKKAIRVATGTTSGNLCQIMLGSNSSTATSLGALASYAPWDSIFTFRHSSASSASAIVFVGFIAGGQTLGASGSTAARIGLELDTVAGDTYFMYVACNGSTCTRTSSGVAADNSWHRLRIRSSQAGTILFSLDGGSETSISTTLPTNAQAPLIGVRTAEAAAKQVETDRFYWYGINAQ